MARHEARMDWTRPRFHQICMARSTIGTSWSDNSSNKSNWVMLNKLNRSANQEIRDKFMERKNIIFKPLDQLNFFFLFSFSPPKSVTQTYSKNTISVLSVLANKLLPLHEYCLRNYTVPKFKPKHISKIQNKWFRFT